MEHARKQDAARALLDLFNTGNGTIYCEPYSGASSQTEMTMDGLKVLKTDQERFEYTVKQGEYAACK